MIFYMATIITLEQARVGAQRHVADTHGSTVAATVVKEEQLYLLWTTAVWEDGCPVTKMFRRSEEILVTFRVGRHIVGCVYAGSNTGCTVFDFFYEGVWYEALYLDAVNLLRDVLGQTQFEANVADEEGPSLESFRQSFRS